MSKLAPSPAYILNSYNHAQLIKLAADLGVEVKKSTPKYDLVNVLVGPYATYLEAKELEKKLAEEAAAAEKAANIAQAILDRADHAELFNVLNAGLNELIGNLNDTRQKFIDYATKYNDIAGAIRHHGEAATKAETQLKVVHSFLRMLDLNRQEPITLADLPVRMTNIMESSTSSLVENHSCEADSVITYRTQYKLAQSVKVVLDRYAKEEIATHFWAYL